MHTHSDHQSQPAYRAAAHAGDHAPTVSDRKTNAANQWPKASGRAIQWKRPASSGLAARSERAPVQRLMKKTGMDKEEFKKATWNTVFLYAELDGKPLGKNGIFHTTSDKHAEENLIAFLEENGITEGDLVVYLSTSPCCSLFGTRDDGQDGCQERLEQLIGKTKINLKVIADHLYLKQDLRSMEKEEFGAQGSLSMLSACQSSFDMTFTKVPKAFKDDLVSSTTNVTQLRTG